MDNSNKRPRDSKLYQIRENLLKTMTSGPFFKFSLMFNSFPKKATGGSVVTRSYMWVVVRLD